MAVDPFGDSVVEEEVLTTVKRWSTVDPYNHQAVVNFLKSEYDLDAATASDLANDQAQRWFNSNGTWPNFRQLLGTESLTNAATWSAGNWSKLPAVFGVSSPEGVSYYMNNPVDGVKKTPITENDLSADFRLAARFGRQLPASPTFTVDQIRSIVTKPPSGGRGGGGAARRDPVFDRNEVIEGVTEAWRGMLLEEPGNPGALADKYINQAIQFSRKGGALDFTTWVLGQIRDTARYQLLYSRKPETMTESQWLSQYVEAVRSLGLPEVRTNQLATAGAQTGAGVAGFTEGLTRLSEFQAGNQGPFSQRLANNIAQLGIRGT